MVQQNYHRHIGAVFRWISNHVGASIALAGSALFGMAYFCERGRYYYLGMPFDPEVGAALYLPSLVALWEILVIAGLFLTLNLVMTIIKHERLRQVYIGVLVSIFALSVGLSCLFEIVWLDRSVFRAFCVITYFFMMWLSAKVFYWQSMAESVPLIQRVNNWVTPIFATIGLVFAAGYTDARYQEKWAVTGDGAEADVVLVSRGQEYLVASIDLKNGIFGDDFIWKPRTTVSFKVKKIGPISSKSQ